MNDAKIPCELSCRIMKCVSTVKMQVLWNGSYTEEFVPSRGVRQGDPLSLYLFVLTMELLGHAINVAVSFGKWKLIVLGRGGPLLSHLFFADDLVLFGEASVENAAVLQETLNTFCRYSGYKINASKSSLFFSNNTNDSLRGAIGNFLGFQQTDDLGMYLGVPLFHSRISKNTFKFIVDKVQKKLNGFDAWILSMAGRVTLAKSVLLPIPGYFMQSSLIPIGVCERIEQIVRTFVWGSSSSGNKVPLVKWETCCQPLLKGGLGLRRLVPQNTSYILKLAFSFVTKLDALWVRTLQAKYKIMDTCPSTIDRLVCSYVWRSLVKVWSLFRERFYWQLGMGEQRIFCGMNGFLSWCNSRIF